MMTREEHSHFEHDFCKAANMAHIAVGLVERHVGDKGTQQEVTGKPDTYYIPSDDVEAMLYAIYETHNQIKELRDRYLKGRECA